MRFFNSRFRFRGDASSDLADANRGFYTATGNTETSLLAVGNERFIFSYLPYGVSNDFLRRELVDVSSTVTYGSDLFGNANAGGPGSIKVGEGKDGKKALVSISNIPVAGNGGPSAGTQINVFSNNVGGSGGPSQGLTVKGLGASAALGASLPASVSADNSGGHTAMVESKGGQALPIYTLPFGLYTAGSWHTVDGRDDGRRAGYTANPLNEQLNPSTRATAVVGTGGGYSGPAYVQFRGGSPEANPSFPDVVQVPVTPSGAYSNNEAQARVVPSNSPYHFAINNAASPTEGNDGVVAPRYRDVPAQGTRSDVNDLLRIYAGKVQSEVDVHQVVPGRSIYYSTSTPAGSVNNVDNLSVGSGVFTDSRLRMSYTWPTIVTNTATGYPAAGSSNLFYEQDVMEVATPNMSGNARFFFTGNFPQATPNGTGLAGAEQDPANYFGKFGFPINPGGGNLVFTGTGVSRTTGGTIQPIHAVTHSIWVPNNADFHQNFPNAYSTPAGGGNNTDIPFTGLRGYVDPATVDYSNGNTVGQDQLLWGRASGFVHLGIGTVGNTITQFGLDRNANPANLNTGAGDRVFFLWLKKDATVATDPNAYACWGGSMLSSGSSVFAAGGRTTAPAFDMRNAGLTITNAQISFAELNGQLGAKNQPLNSNTSIGTWRRTEFELLRNIVGAPAQSGIGARVKLMDPRVDATVVSSTLPTGTAFDTVTTPNTYDGLVQNSVVVYGIRDRGTKTSQNGATYSNLLGEAGLEPGAPVIAQWWNTGTGTDIASGSFPNVMKAYSTTWLPAEYTEVVHVNHNYVSKVQYPTTADASPIDWKLYGQIGVIAPKGHSLLTGDLKPVVTPVRQLYINDFVTNYADGNPAGNPGTMLDIFNGNARNILSGAPAPTVPSYKVMDGNGTGPFDWTLNGHSSVQLSWQPAVNDLRHPSGYIVTFYRVFPGFLQVMREVRMAHTGGIGARQVLNLPSFSFMDASGPYNPGAGTAAYLVKVRNVWMEGTEGAAGHSFDMGKAPFAQRFPMAYADVISGVFVVRY
ncbi:MAG: hypothetical protein U0P81_02405 [Holophagaceae bacterium]